MQPRNEPGRKGECEDGVGPESDGNRGNSYGAQGGLGEGKGGQGMAWEDSPGVPKGPQDGSWKGSGPGKGLRRQRKVQFVFKKEVGQNRNKGII
jgi:hypothetical protein